MSVRSQHRETVRRRESNPIWQFADNAAMTRLVGPSPDSVPVPRSQFVLAGALQLSQIDPVREKLRDDAAYLAGKHNQQNLNPSSTGLLSRGYRVRVAAGAPFPKEFADFDRENILGRAHIEQSDRSGEFTPELAHLRFIFPAQFAHRLVQRMNLFRKRIVITGLVFRRSLCGRPPLIASCYRDGHRFSSVFPTRARRAKRAGLACSP